MRYDAFCSCLLQLREGEKRSRKDRQRKEMETDLMDGKRQNLQLEREE